MRFVLGPVRVLIMALAVASWAPCLAVAQIQWRSASLASGATAHTDTLEVLKSAARGSAGRHLVVQFDAPVSPEQRAQLEQAGITLQAYLGGNGYFAMVSSTADVQAAVQLPGLRHARPVDTSWKLHPALARGETPAWAVEPRPEGAPAGAEPTLLVQVLFHEDVSAAGAAAAVQTAGGEVIGRFVAIPGASVRVPVSRVRTLAELDEVMYVEPAQPALHEANAENRALTGAELVQAAPYGLSGGGVTVMVYDGGVVRSTHVDFLGRLTILDDNPIGVHATHVAGTIGGSGAGYGDGFDRGMAPGAHLLSYSFDYPLPPQGLTLVTDPLDLEVDVADAMARGADVMNASLASNIAPSGLDCALEGDYTVVSSIIDAIVRGAYGRPFLSVWGGGNERSSGACGTGFGTVPPPHAGKNHIVVGAVNANDDSMTNFSSWGPVDDGRIKPDLVAPGCQVGGDNGVTSASGFDDTGYVTICGTSMAAPTVTGLAALLIEDFKAQFPGRPLFRSATLKALLAHTAVDLGHPGPDYRFGYGSVRIQPAIELMRSGAFREDTIGHGGTFSRSVTIAPGEPELKVTLAWDDYPTVPNVLTSLVNDLDLVVTSPSAVRHYPWTLNPASPDTPAVRVAGDHLNNIEQVMVENPEPGTWTIEVLGYNVPAGPQSFTLIGDGASPFGLTIDLPGGPLESIPPGIPTPLEVQIVVVGDDIVPGSALLHYRFDGGAFQALPLVAMGDSRFTVTIPEAACGDVLEYYLTVAGIESPPASMPPGAPASYLSAPVGAMTAVFADDFETDQGWTTSVVGATDGPWERGVPVPRTALAFGPQFDADGSGQCYVTDNATGLSDVDAGSVVLTSPAIDLSGPFGEISFLYYFYTNAYTAGDDRLTAEVSTAGPAGPWVELFRYRYPTGAASDTVWHSATITSAMIGAAGLTLSADTRIRFIARDGGTASTVEAGIDGVTASAFRCVAPTCSDGVRNQGEARIDCGGPCAPCACTEDAICSNAIFCDGVEVCDAYGACAAGAAPCSAAMWCSETLADCIALGDGDFDSDQDVDLADFHRFQGCIGYSAETLPACAPGNLAGTDGAVDLSDFADFAGRLDASGPQ